MDSSMTDVQSLSRHNLAVQKRWVVKSMLSVAEVKIVLYRKMLAFSSSGASESLTCDPTDLGLEDWYRAYHGFHSSPATLRRIHASYFSPHNHRHQLQRSSAFSFSLTSSSPCELAFSCRSQDLLLLLMSSAYSAVVLHLGDSVLDLCLSTLLVDQR